MSRLPYEHVRIIEQSATLTGRLVGLLFADQGAEVLVESLVAAATGEHDAYPVSYTHLTLPTIYSV